MEAVERRVEVVYGVNMRRVDESYRVMYQVSKIWIDSSPPLASDIG